MHGFQDSKKQFIVQMEKVSEKQDTNTAARALTVLNVNAAPKTPELYIMGCSKWRPYMVKKKERKNKRD